MNKIEEFEKRFNEINNGSNQIVQLHFVWELMKTPFTEYHYSLIINESTNEKFRNHLWSRFDEHNDAEAFLLKKLDAGEDKA